MVVAQRLTRRFDGLLAVDELSLNVAEGEVLGLAVLGTFLAARAVFGREEILTRWR